MNATDVIQSYLRGTAVADRPKNPARPNRPKVPGPRTKTRKAIRGFPPHFVPGGVVGAPLTLSQALRRLREAAVVLAGTAVEEASKCPNELAGAAFVLAGHVITHTDVLITRRSAT